MLRGLARRARRARLGPWVGGAATAAGVSAAASCSAPNELGRADLTGDGVEETRVFDTTGDGLGDGLDTTGDGEVDTVLVDLYRDTPLRYMGYANEVGEAFRPIIPKLVLPSYGVAILYVLADTRDKATKAYNQSVAASPTGAANSTRVVEQAADCLIWQLAASVFIPGFVIHQVVHFLGWSLKKSAKVPALARTWVPTVGGLAAIPIIIHPIDHGVDYVMDRTVRTMYSASRPKAAVGSIDLTGDGKEETTAYDTVGDGKADALDTTGDGKIDKLLVPRK